MEGYFDLALPDLPDGVVPLPPPPTPCINAPRRLLPHGTTSEGQCWDGLVGGLDDKMGAGSSLQRRRRRHGFATLSTLFLASFVSCASAAFVPFKNCLGPAIIDSDPLVLQFVPMMVSATLDTSSVARNLDVTVYGNVSGLASQQPYPPPDDPHWSDPSKELGKIVDVDEQNGKISTLFGRLNVLSFTPYINDPVAFCSTLTQGECPLGPVFDSNQSDPSELRAFSVSHDLFSAYAFTSLSSSIKVSSGDAESSQLVCISADITPDLGNSLRGVLRFIPLVILIMVGVATISAAIYSPWGSTDLFRWTSNYGRDEDLLRLVTPGFGDCLQYIQFIVLTGSLTLDYPGYYQPVVSQAGWSTLMFNESFVSHGDGIQPVQDGVYNVNASYGLHSMGQYVGMIGSEDIWAGMVVWLLCVVAAVTFLTQLGFALRWVHHKIGHVTEEDLRAKNMPFTVGNVVRLVFNYFLLPLVSLSMFQFVVARSSPVYTVALAVVLLVVLIGFTSWLLVLVARTRPRSFLFDDLPTVLLYGPLYNTYSDEAAPFALVSVLLTFMRGVAVGAVQPSGVAQVVLLAICEVILVLTIVAFRPFHYATSMNAYHTFFAVVRCVTILLSVAFVPSLNVSPAARGWIGYVILLLHAIVLVFGFFLNAIQTLIEVIARLAGAGGEGGAEGGAARGGLVQVFGLRQLSRRGSRKGHVPQHSVNSQAAILGGDIERPSTQLDLDRARSFSGSSALLLARGGADSRVSGGFDSGSLYGTGNSRTGGSGRYTPTTPGTMNAFPVAGHQSGGGGSPRSGVVGFRQPEVADPYYRPPRQRRATLDGSGDGRRRQGSSISGDWAQTRQRDTAEGGDDGSDQVDTPGASGDGAPTPAYLKAPRDDPDDGDDQRPRRTDYAVREVDFYYGVRGPALSNVSNRRLKTGPADPTGPVSSATGWLRNIFSGKTKEKGKGFEVVRSTRAPPPGLIPPAERDSFAEPYQDEPASAEQTAGAAAIGVALSGQQDSDEKPAEGQAKGPKKGTGHSRAPSLPPIVASDSIELPNRSSSQREPQGIRSRPPTIPRKSSKRHSSVDMQGLAIENVTKPPPTTFEEGEDTPTPTNKHLPDSQAARMFPFGSQSSSTRSGFASNHSTGSSAQHHDEESSAYGGAGHNRKASKGDPERPSNVGYVRQHRASDHIHQADSSDPPLLGSSAEIVKGPP